MSRKAPVSIGKLIVSRPGVQGGRPCLEGTRMPVHGIAARHLQGMSAEDILQQFPHLDLGRIHAALAYYHANKELIEAELEEDRRVGPRTLLAPSGEPTGS